jgi:predicted enzyme related to lactoylglutathione lyase
MANSLVHFELPAEDPSRAKAFWSGLCGWEFQPPPEWIEYHMTDGGGGPGGAIFRADAPERGLIVYFGTDDIDASLADVRKLGGTVSLEKQPIPGVGWFARCRDTEGNDFSLFQGDETVPPPS